MKQQSSNGFKRILSAVICLFVVTAAWAQRSTVTGTVTDANGDPIIGATVKVANNPSVGTATDFNGNFTFTIDGEQMLEVSYIGFNPLKVKSQKTPMKIVLKESSQMLNEVVVVGYGTQKKVNLTGAVQSVGEEAFENRSLANVSQALQGAIPNLNLELEDGKPTRSATFNVRGTGSIGQGGDALVLIDGVESDISMLNPNDIESVSVLKDASSSAIYGARGTFGVVLITTKNAKKERTSVNYTGNFSFQSPTKTPDYVTGGIEFAEHFRSAWYNYYGTVPTALNGFQSYSDAWLEEFKARRAAGNNNPVEINEQGKYIYYGNTDWYDELYKDSTFAQDHNVTISGGNEKADFYISGRYYKYDGLYNFNPDTYRSTNLRAKGSLKLTNWLKVSNNMEYSTNKSHMPTVVSSAWIVNRFIELTAFPTMPLFNPDGTYTKSMGATMGAFADGNNFKDRETSLFRNTASFSASFLNDQIHVNGDYTYRQSNTNTLTKNYDVYFSESVGASSKRAGTNSVAKGDIVQKYNAVNIYADYENTFNDVHYFKGMIGYNYENSNYDSSSMSRNGLLMAEAGSIALAIGDNIGVGESYWKWETAGMFFRMNYAYDNRYLLEVNGRYDGSSKFPKNDKWAFFPSVSAGWRISEEPFFKNNVSTNAVSNLKLRGSYGSLGNGNVTPYSYLELLNFTKQSRIIGGQQNYITSVPSVKPESLTWETATNWNIGFDAAFLPKGALTISADYYVRKTKDMYTVGMTLPDVFGASSPKGNYADMTTRGWEITVAYRNSFNLADSPFRYSVRASVYDNFSKIDKYNNPNKNLSDYYEGMTLGEMWGYTTDGLFQSDAETQGYVNTIMSSSANKTWHAGDVKFVDSNGNGRIDYGDNTVDNPGDRKIIGNSLPRYQFSFGFDIDWKNFFLGATFTGVGKQNWYPTMESSAFWGQYNRPYNNVPSWHIGNYWTEDNPDAYLPRYSTYNMACGRGGANFYNDRYIQNVAYIRLKNLQFGYNLPKSLLRHIFVQDAKIYLTGENLWSWSPLYKRVKGFDVMSITGDTDTDMSNNSQGSGNSYPLLKSLTLGLSVTF